MAQLDLRLPRPFTVRTLALALLSGAAVISPAWAQSSLPQVRITEDTTIRSNMRGHGDVLMRPAAGTVLELIDMDGDRYSHRDGNWYLVLLPRDAWGAQRTGWVAGDDVELVPPVVRPRVMFNAPADPVAGGAAPAVVAAPAAAPVARASATNVAAAAPAQPPAMSDLVLRFEFGRSELTADARAALTGPAAELKASARAFAFSVEGHADWVGNETFNEKLGLARAESVRKFLAEQYQIPDEKMTIVSYGEGRPVAANTTAEGRAQNRRVVVKVRP